MYSTQWHSQPSLISSMQGLLDQLTKARDEPQKSSGDHSMDRFAALEQSLLTVDNRLERLESSYGTSSYTNSERISPDKREQIAHAERIMREMMLEYVKMQNNAERYRLDNKALQDRLAGHFSSSSVTPQPRVEKTNPPPTTSVPMIRPGTSHTTDSLPQKAPVFPTSPRNVLPPKPSSAERVKRPASAEEEPTEEDPASLRSPPVVRSPPAAEGAASKLPVDFPPGYNQHRGRRFSVMDTDSPAHTDFTNMKRTIVPKSEDVKNRIRVVITNNILFNNLDEESMEELIDEMFEVKLTPDEVIIRQGDDGDNFYVIDIGELYVLYKDVVVATIGSGKSFGEIALMYNCPRTATVRAKTQAILWGMSRNTFRRSLMAYAIRKRELYESFLARVPLLEGLLPYERSIIADALKQKVFKEGEYIIRQGEKGDNFYILEKGRVVATKTEGTTENEVKSYGEGDYFGELALLNDQLRAANVKAVGGPVRALCLSREDFANLMGPCEDILQRNTALYQKGQQGR